MSPAWTNHWAKALCASVGIDVRTEGNLPSGGCLLTPNHIGYCDILALAHTLPTVFVAKSEIASWPVIGRLFEAAGHISVARGNRRSLPQTCRDIASFLGADQKVCVFLEGTSTGGDAVRPFHSSLVQAAIDTQTPLVPVAIRWSALQPGVRIDEDVAYWKDHAFVPHLWRFLGLRGIAAVVRFGAPIESSGRNRKELAAEAHRIVRRMLQGSPHTF